MIEFKHLLPLGGSLCLGIRQIGSLLHFNAVQRARGLIVFGAGF